MTALNALDALGAADPMIRGREAMRRGDHAAAAAEFLAQVAATPVDHEARYWLASAGCSKYGSRNVPRAW